MMKASKGVCQTGDREAKLNKVNMAWPSIVSDTQTHEIYLLLLFIYNGRGARSNRLDKQK